MSFEIVGNDASDSDSDSDSNYDLDLKFESFFSNDTTLYVGVDDITDKYIKIIACVAVLYGDDISRGEIRNVWADELGKLLKIIKYKRRKQVVAAAKVGGMSFRNSADRLLHKLTVKLNRVNVGKFILIEYAKDIINNELWKTKIEIFMRTQLDNNEAF